MVFSCTFIVKSCTEVRHHLHDSSGLRDLLRLSLARLLRQHLLRLRRNQPRFYRLPEREKAGQCQEVQTRSMKMH